ncbi:hypothetical protein RB594_005694 [Gaeumannomyces avenae]
MGLLWSPGPSQGSRSSPLARLAMLPLALLAVATFLASVTAAADCFFSDGSTPKGEDRIVACSWNKDLTGRGTCCVIGDVCLTNAGCMRGGAKETDDDRFYIGACTSKTGESCTDVCSNRGEIVPLNLCAEGNNSYVCDGTGQCDKSFGGTILMGATITSGGTALDPKGTPIPPNSSSGRSDPATTDATTSTSDPRAPGSAPTSSSPGQTAAPDAPSNSTGNSTGPADQPQDANGTIPLAVGVSIGGVAIAAACGIGFWMWRERKKREPARADSPPPATLEPYPPATENNNYYGDPRNALRQEAFMRMHGH